MNVFANVLIYSYVGLSKTGVSIDAGAHGGFLLALGTLPARDHISMQRARER